MPVFLKLQEDLEKEKQYVPIGLVWLEVCVHVDTWVYWSICVLVALDGSTALDVCLL